MAVSNFFFWGGRGRLGDLAAQFYRGGIERSASPMYPNWSFAIRCFRILSRLKLEIPPSDCQIK